MEGKIVDRRIIIGLCLEVWTLLRKEALEHRMTVHDYANSLLESYLLLQEDLELHDSDID
ncbi:MAG: hypothetical protein WBP64_09775 [Nitrososphaeraceae archaeon]